TSNLWQISGEPTGKFLLGVSGQSGDNNIHVFPISPSAGALLTSTNVPTAGTPRNLVVHPNGKGIYTFSEDSVLDEANPVEGYVFDNTAGTMTQISGSPFSTVAAGGAIEQSGQFLFALGSALSNGANSTVTPYSIDSTTGSLAAWPSGAGATQGFPGV